MSTNDRSEDEASGQPESPAPEGSRKRSRSKSSNGGSNGSTSDAQLRALVKALKSVKQGDFTVRLAEDAGGVMGEVAAAFNEVAALNERMSKELYRVGRVVGREGKMTERATLGHVSGSWASTVESVNSLIGDLVRPTTEVARVISAVAEGDLNQKIPLEIDGKPVKGEFQRIGITVNTMVDQLSSFADEVTRVAREVGTDGKLGGQADVPGVAGIWKDLTDNVNLMASNLTTQVRGIAKVVTAVANGDLNQKLVVEAKGEIAELADTINNMTDTLGIFADQVTSVAREVGTEGKLGGQAEVPGVAGTWKDLTDNVNFMASNLTGQVRNIALVTTAVANGDLSQKITVDVKGEILELKNTINVMVDQLRGFASEVTRVAREVGTDGKLGGQADVPGVAGTWKDLTDSVNFMASNLTGQVRNIALVTTAVANGDLSQKITVDVKGEILELKNTINVMVDQLRAFAAEVTRVAREVGTEGKLGGQADVPGVGGTWKDLTDSVNFMASNLTGQVRNIALVTTAVANGDLSQKITVDVKGEILELKNTINVMVDQLRAFAAEVTRVAREVGTEGKLGGQADVPGVAGTWKDLTDNVNFMASNLTGQVRNIALVTTAVANGDLSQKITVDVKGEILELKNTINVMVDQLRAFAAEVTRVAREVGTDGKLGGQANVPGIGGTWKDLTDNVNFMASNLTTQVRGIAKVVTAVANGDLSKKLVVEAKGEIAELAETINSMTDTLGIFAEQVTTVAREVGTEGKLGGQAKVPGVGGTWKDLTDNVNLMASNLTTQVRGIVKVVTAVANGDLSQKLLMQSQGEIAALADTINSMTDTLRLFAEQVTSVAREVGIDGKLGGQANVPGASGTWKDLTENVNRLAGNLTTQVRSIAEVATAVTKGDLTRTITVDALGEILELKNNVNQMIANLRETTQKNSEQDWLKSNLARFSSMMQGQKSLESVSSLIMSELTPLVSANHGAFFIADGNEKETVLKLVSSYAYQRRKNVSNRFAPGEGLVGQSALEKKSIMLTNVPDDYIQINSGLGEAPPKNIVVLPILFEGEVKAVVELASFNPFNEIHQIFLDQLSETIGVVLNMIGANMRTEQLLEQSQRLTEELQSQSKELQQQQDELKRSNSELEAQARSLKASEELLKAQQEELQQINEELEEKASLLAEQNQKIELKNREVELARLALEEKAEQLALSSQYKSEFLANMSHELRTPLNSLLILAKLLADNRDQNLTEKQVEYARTIHAAGSDLLNLINEVLDLAKVESGKMEIQTGDVAIDEVTAYLDRNFRPLATEKGLEFALEKESDAPESIETDGLRLQQVLKNLLSNAFKFTETGRIAVTARRVPKGEIRFSNDRLAAHDEVVAFAVSDSGIGIAKDKQRLIFEAFQQADGTTSRKYGGTGLGLSISREIARLLGGEIRVESAPGEGSTFTLYLPYAYEELQRPRGALRAAFDGSSAPGAFGTGLPFAESRESDVLELPEVDEETLRDNRLADDRDDVQPGDRALLIVEDDLDFAKILLEIARERGFKGVVALRGDTGLALAHEYKPDAVLLDIELPVLDGWQVLDRLKHHRDTRHIPVHILSGTGTKHRSLASGALAYLEKPVSKETLDDAFTSMSEFLDRGVRNLLVVEDDATQRMSIAELIGEDDVQTTAVGSAEEALDELQSKSFDCMVLDLGLPDMTGFDLLEKVKSQPDLQDLPIIIYTGRKLTPQEETRIRKYAETIIIKDVRSPERLLDETALFLHRVEANLPEAKRRVLEQLHSSDSVFEDKKVLVVDDDVRNIFALTSVLEGQGMTVLFAENGRDAIETLEATPDVDLVLMDVMMPEMDGYETMRRIRSVQDYLSLPIIALTAKAMKGDREKCIAAGASDYITKPVDPDQLLSLMRVWLYQ